MRTHRTAGGFTIFEVLVVITLVTVLLTLLLPALNQAKEIARKTKCAAQVKQMGVGMFSYAIESKNWLMPYAYGTSSTNYGHDPRWTHVLGPYLGGELMAADLPAFMPPLLDSQAITWLLIVALAAVVLPILSQHTRLMILLIAVLVAFGSGFELTRYRLGRRLTHQRGEAILYPWKAFEQELTDAGPRRILLSRTLIREYGMAGAKLTRSRIARLYLRQSHIRVDSGTALHAEVEYAIGSRHDLERWREEIESRRRRAVFDSSGQFVLIYPRESRQDP